MSKTLTSNDDEAYEDEILEKSYFADEFKQQTDDPHITLSEYIDGTFSNSVTTDSDLSVDITVFDNIVRISLAEYGEYVVKNCDTTYLVKVSLWMITN